MTDGMTLLPSQIVGAPDWVNTMQVNVDARTASGETIGPKMRPSTADCFPAPRDMPTPPVQSARCFSGIFRSGTIAAPNSTMDALARNLTQLGGADRIVVDRTRLTGKYEIDLRWSPDVTQPSDDPPLVTAIQEQLGLKLEPGNEQLPAVVIDHIEQPSPN
jgi:uncharacterized protein (TIGR03435 family)